MGGAGVVIQNLKFCKEKLNRRGGGDIARNNIICELHNVPKIVTVRKQIISWPFCSLKPFFPFGFFLFPFGCFLTLMKSMGLVHHSFLVNEGIYLLPSSLFPFQFCCGRIAVIRLVNPLHAILSTFQTCQGWVGYQVEVVTWSRCRV